jgi:trk system potassium uptake protein TrkA
MKMKIIVVGCGRFGSELAYRLSKLGHEIAVIDNTSAAFHNLPADFLGRTIEGDALNQDVLFRAGIKQADALAAVTNSDVLNAVIARVAQSIFGLKNVVVRNYDPSDRLIFESFSAQVISSTSWGAQRIEEMICQPEIKTVLSAGNGEIEVYEVKVPASWSNRTIHDLVQSSECLLVSLTRVGRAVLPTQETHLMEGDILQLSATIGGIQGVQRRLNAMREA